MSKIERILKLEEKVAAMEIELKRLAANERIRSLGETQAIPGTPSHEYWKKREYEEAARQPPGNRQSTPEYESWLKRQREICATLERNRKLDLATMEAEMFRAKDPMGSAAS